MVSPLSSYRRQSSLGRDRRRLAVLAAFAGYPLLQVGYSTFVAPDGVSSGLSSTIWAPVALVLLGLTLAAVALVYGYARDRMVPVWFPFFGTPTTARQPLDERQRSMHDRALVLGYRILSLAIGLTIGGAVGIAINEPIVIDLPALIPFIVVFALYVPFLPFAVLAWIEPDPPVDEEDRAG